MFDHNREAGAARLKLFRSQLLLRGLSIAGVARAVHVVPPHLRLVILGERRASERLLESLRSVLGDDVLAFIIPKEKPQGERI